MGRIVDSRRGYFLREPLREESFLCGEDARAGGHWAEPENWGTWLCHSAGDVVLGLAANESQLYYVFLRLRMSGPVANVPLKLLANGEVAWQGTIGSRPKDVMMRVRRRARGDGGMWRLKLRADADVTAERREEIAAMDSRLPTIGFERLLVVPENDLKVRLDVLSNLLL